MWPKHPLAPEHAMQYVDDIEKICSVLDYKFYHQKTLYNIHQKYGEYLHRYKRNKNTTWYLIYNIDFHDNIWIEKIMNNYLTVE